MAANRPRRSLADTRAHVLAVAHELFYWRGIHSTGIDKIAAAAQVAPVTLYRLFASKDDLIAAYAASNSAPYKEWMAHATRPELGSPRDRLLALFGALAEQVEPGRCRGCPFLMILAEFPDPGHPAHAEAVAVKAWAREHIRGVTRELAADAPLADLDALADQIVIIVEGVYASVQALGNEGPARQARAIVATLLDAAVPERRAATLLGGQA